MYNVTKAKINGFNYESLQTKNNTVIRTFGAKDNFEIFKDYICKNDVGYVKLIKNNDFLPEFICILTRIKLLY